MNRIHPIHSLSSPQTLYPNLLLQYFSQDNILNFFKHQELQFSIHGGTES